MPRSSSFRVRPSTPSSPKQLEEMKVRLFGGHPRSDVESIIGARGGKKPGDEDEFLVRWLGTGDSDWVPGVWLEFSMSCKGKVMEFQERARARVLYDASLVVQRSWRSYRQRVYERQLATATVRAQAIARGKRDRRQLHTRLLSIEADIIERESQIAKEMKTRAAEVAAQKRQEERDAKKAEQMRLVREQAQKLIEQQGSETMRIDPDMPLAIPNSPKGLGPITRLPRSPRANSARGGGLKPGKMGYQDYVAALDLQMHRERVNTIRPAVDTVSPPVFQHLKQKLKYRQLELEREMHIHHENEVLARRVKAFGGMAGGDSFGETANSTGNLNVKEKDPAQAFEAKMQKMDHQQHRRRVTRMKHAVDADSPKRYKHLTQNLKGKQNLEDQRLETERNNRASQKRLAQMFRSESAGEKDPAQNSKTSVANQASAATTVTSARSSRSAKSGSGRKNAFQEHLLEIDKKLLRDRVKNMRPGVDTVAPPVYKHLKQNLKGKMILSEKEAEIKRLNEIQDMRVANTTSISKFPKVPNMSRRAGAELTWEQKIERACMHGDEPMLNQALQHVEPSAMLGDTWFPVALCAASGQLGVLNALVRIAHKDAERKMVDGSTPLRLAAGRGHANCVDGLLKAHADADIVAACRVAAENGHLDVIECFLSKRLELLLGLSHNALVQLRTKVAQKTPNIDALPQHLRNCFRRIDTRLRLIDTYQDAAKTGDVPTLSKCLRDPGLRVQVIFRTGWHALGLAAAGNHSDAVLFLLKQGARVDAGMSDGRTALEIATQCGHIDVATLLIESNSATEAEEEQVEVAGSRKSARKLKAAAKQDSARGASLVPQPPPKRGGAWGAAKGSKGGRASARRPREYNWECGEVEGQTLLFGAVNAIGATV